MQSLRELARAELAGRIAAAAEEGRRLKESQRQNLIARSLRMLREIGAPTDAAIVHEDAATVEIDGLRFLGPHLLGTCPACGAQVASAPIGSLAVLGRLIEHFVPDTDHRCSGWVEESEEPDADEPRPSMPVYCYQLRTFYGLQHSLASALCEAEEAANAYLVALQPHEVAHIDTRLAAVTDDDGHGYAYTITVQTYAVKVA